MTPHRVPTFVPGTMCDRRVWAEVWRAMGIEKTAGYIPVETCRTRAEIMSAFHDRAAQGAMHLVGFSMGGYLSLEFALEQPDAVASLVLICTSARGLSDEEKVERRKAVSFLETHEYRGISTSRLNHFVHPSRQSDPAVIGVVREMDRDLGHETLIAQMRETSERVSLMPQLATLRCPVLLVSAEDDNLVETADIDEMVSLIPGSSRAIAIEAGHMLPLEQPAWLASQIAEFHSSF